MAVRTSHHFFETGPPRPGGSHLGPPRPRRRGSARTLEAALQARCPGPAFFCDSARKQGRELLLRAARCRPGRLSPSACAEFELTCAFWEESKRAVVRRAISFAAPLANSGDHVEYETNGQHILAFVAALRRDGYAQLASSASPASLRELVVVACAPLAERWSFADVVGLGESRITPAGKRGRSTNPIPLNMFDVT